MKPVIVHPEGVPGNAFLIDLHSVVHTKSDPTGHPGQIALAALHIGDLKPGHFKISNTKHGAVESPRPCILSAWEGMKEMQLLWRGIYPDAAEALLRISACSLSIEAGHEKGKIGGRKWHSWQFMAAWFWSKWQQDRRDNSARWTIKQRWEEMKSMGYPFGETAFRKMLTEDLRLFVTKSSPHR